MATTLTINETKTNNSITKTSIKVYLSFTTTYAGKYKVGFETYDRWGSKVNDTFGAVFDLPENGSSGEIYKTISGLSSGEFYTVYAELYNATTNKKLGISDNISFTTEKTLTAEIVNVADNVNGNSVTIGANAKAGEAGEYRLFFVVNDINDQTVASHDTGYATYDRGETFYKNHTFTGLDYSSDYTYIVGIFLKGSITAKDNKSGSFTTGRSPKPSAWSWSGQVKFNGVNHSCPIVSGGEVPYFKVDETTYKVYFIGATEWNDFCQKINELRSYCGKSAYSFTPVSPDTTMYAETANDAIRALDGIEATKTQFVKDGERVGATVFIDLASEYNRIRNKY